MVLHFRVIPIFLAITMKKRCELVVSGEMVRIGWCVTGMKDFYSVNHQ
jgi:hypothetical protein